MSSEISSLCRAFCRALHSHTGGQPDQWRSTRIIAALARIHASETVAAVVTHGTKAGWLLKVAPDRVALTDEGRRMFSEERLARPDRKPRNWIVAGRR